jgi:adenylate cyclase
MSMSSLFECVFSKGHYTTTVVVLTLSHLVLGMLLLLYNYGYLQALELSIYDILLRNKASNYKHDERITLLLCDDEDQRRYGWPLSDKVMADAFERLLKHEPRAIGLDLYRDLPVPIEGGADFERLSAIFRDNQHIIAITKITDQYGARVDPPPALKGSGQVGFNDVLADPQGLIRRGILFMGKENFPYLGLLLANLYLTQENLGIFGDKDGFLRMGNAEYSLRPLSSDFGGYTNIDANGYQFILSYPGAPHGFNSLTLRELLADDFEARIVRDKIVLIGTNAEATPDFFFTPIAKTRIPGVSIHAYNVSQFLHYAEGKHKPLQAWESKYEYLWFWLWAIIAALLSMESQSLLRWLWKLMLGASMLATTLLYAYMHNYWLPASVPGLSLVLGMVTTMAYLSYQQRTERAELMQIFSKHVSKEVAEVIWQAREQYLNNGRLRSQRLVATVMFTDLRNFTALSEKLDPQDLMDWLNEYMDAMVSVVDANHGQVNKFIGDAIMALFGVPVPRVSDKEIQQDAVNALKCALAMRDELERLHEIWNQRDLPFLGMRIGIFTGPVIAGSLGGAQRQEYTVIGDSVNTASRLESLDKNIDEDVVCRILISQATVDVLPPDLFEIQPVGNIKVKGKEDALAIYRVLCYHQDSPPQPKRLPMPPPPATYPV